MSNYIHVTEIGTTWPFTRSDLVSAYPNVSFPSSPTAEDLAPFNVYPVQPTPQPAHDPRTQAVEQITPIQQDGQWLQAWEIRPATPTEIAAYDAAHAPQPQWVDFSTALMAHPLVRALLLELVAKEPGFFGGLIAGLSEASKGNTRIFLSTWEEIVARGLVSIQLTDSLYSLATSNHLPIASTFLPNAQSLGQEHRAPDGQLWRVVQSRSADGQFTPDDPATPERESLSWELVPDQGS